MTEAPNPPRRSMAAPPRRSLAAPIILGLAITLLIAVAIKRVSDRRDSGDDSPDARDAHGAEAGEPRVTNRIADFGEVADFRLIDTDGKPFGRQELLGKVWVLDFVFTSCSGPCIPMTAGMRTIVHDLQAEPDVEFVSVSVDPETDTPSVLKNFAHARGAENPRWHWLTGEKAAIFELAQKSFLATVGEKLPSGQVPHSTRYFVVDRDAHLRMVHDTQTDPDPDHGPARGVIETVRKLLASPRLGAATQK